MAVSLRTTLQNVFGYQDFRDRQLEVVEAVVQGKDASVIWSTGAGKSICYQLPAFHTGKTVVVVSPLISLMQDQVAAINAKCGRIVAGFLGSAQTDDTVKRDAYEGKLRLVYATPEKACTGDFLSALKDLQKVGALAAVAIDEAHCVSEWGHDFRPSYRGLTCLRENLGGVPLLALTATATIKVQTDIQKVLKLRDTPWHVHSVATVDRPNLNITVREKKGLQEDLRALANHLVTNNEPTIIYAPTIAEVGTIAEFMRKALQGEKIEVGAYHADLHHETRKQTHLAFLTGTLRVVVATIAFGMGIDKPDLRRVVHYGAPKTFEEYYQQIGRAGRDGLPSWCLLLFSHADFPKYMSDFFVKNLTEEQIELRKVSLDALRAYCSADCTKCRRFMICKHFDETPSYDACGTCDLCKQRERSGDTRRDFTKEAAVICRAISLNPNGCTKTHLWQIVRGAYKGAGANNYIHPSVAAGMPSVAAAFKMLGRRLSDLEALFPSLIDGEYIARRTQRTQGLEFNRAYDMYSCGPKGQVLAVRSEGMKVSLPAPQAILELEAQREQKAKAVRKELEEAGVDLSRVPPEELESGEGRMIKAATEWTRIIKHYRGKEATQAMADKLESLRTAIIAWRNRTAVALAVAPHHVLEDHIIMGLAYSRPRSREALAQLGVRVRLDDVLALLTKQYEELGLLTKGIEEAGDQDENEVMILPAGDYTPAKKWEHAIYKGGRAGKPAVWEVSLQRFQKGEHPEAIAASPESGRPILPATVCGHLLDALTHARTVNLQRLAEAIHPPSKAQWEKLEQACAVQKVDVRAATVAVKDVLRGVLGDEKADKEYGDRSDDEKAEWSAWSNAFRWYRTFKCADIPISWGPSAKRQRLGA